MPNGDQFELRQPYQREFEVVTARYVRITLALIARAGGRHVTDAERLRITRNVRKSFRRQMRRVERNANKLAPPVVEARPHDENES